MMRNRTVNESDWRNCTDHTSEVKNNYRSKDKAREHLTDKLMINLNNSNHSEDAEEMEV